MYREGTGVKAEPVKARDWFEKAANGGNVDAMVNLYEFYKKDGAYANDKLSRVWLEKAADAGDPRCMNDLAILLTSGKPRPEDLSRAKLLLEQSAETGLTSAMKNLGLMYTWGRFVSTDSEAGARWLERSAQNGLCSAILLEREPTHGKLHVFLADSRHLIEFYFTPTLFSVKNGVRLDGAVVGEKGIGGWQREFEFQIEGPKRSHPAKISFSLVGIGSNCWIKKNVVLEIDGTVIFSERQE
jgi:hypothetical protein